MSGQRAVTEQSRSTCADVSRVSVHRFISDFGLRMKSRITRVHTRPEIVDAGGQEADNTNCVKLGRYKKARARGLCGKCYLSHSVALR